MKLMNKQGRGSKNTKYQPLRVLEIKLRKKVHKDVKIGKIILLNRMITSDSVFVLNLK